MLSRLVLAVVLLSGSSQSLDVSAPLAFKNAARCEFQPSGERLLRGMLHPSGSEPELVADPKIRIGREILRVHFERVREPDTGYITYRSRVDLPAGTSWNGLSLLSLRLEEFVPPEVDGLSARELVFASSERRVRERFERLGVRFAHGSESFIDKPLHGCEGVIRIEPSGRLTRLRCEWGC